MSIFKNLFWYFLKEKKNYLLGILILIVVDLLNLIPPYLIGQVVDAIKNHNITKMFLLEKLSIIFSLAIIIYVLRYFWRIFIFGSAIKLGALLREKLYQHFTLLSPSFYHKRRIGDLMAHSTNDVEAVETAAGEGVLTLVDSLSMGSLVIISMLILDWRLTLLALIPMPFMAWLTSYYGTLLHKRFDQAQAAFSDLNDKVQENIAGVRVIKAFGQEEKETLSFQKLSNDVVKKNILVAEIDSLFGPTITLIVGISFMIALVFGSFFVVDDKLTIGQLTTFTIYLGHLIWPMLAFGWLFNIVERGSASYERISKLLNEEPEVKNKENAQDLKPKGDLSYQIKEFSYPNANNPTLENIFFTLEQGKTLGVVGKTGSGKTTLLRLLLREFTVSNGDILISNKSIYDYTLQSLRKGIGYVPQDHFLFSATVYENIAFAKSRATKEEVEGVAKIANIHQDIELFPNGYQTVVGERGVTLSGGQKQRISIARALLVDPEILILDDSLSAVDAKTEKGILEELKTNRENKTTIIAAHRLSAVEHADLIIVLANGRIIERGTHNELMAQNGWYKKTYLKQQLESSLEEKLTKKDEEDHY